MSERSGETRLKKAYLRRIRSLSLWDRRDVTLFILAGLAAAILAGILWALVAVGKRLDVFIPPEVRQVDDARILENVRDELPGRGFLGATQNAKDGVVYVAQEGGRVHRYDPATQLWSSEIPFGSDAPVARNFVSLQFGCGSAPDSANAPSCADPDTLWALGDDGSLARKRGSQWEIMVSNSRFLGANGAPVNEEDLTAAAVSSDGRWLLLGTRSNGVGLYDILSHTWISNTLANAGFRAQAISHAVWWRGGFWIGTPTGVQTLDVNGGRPRIDAPKDMTGNVLDLDADEAEGLYALVSRPCLQSGSDCLWLGKLDRPGAQAQPLVDEQNRFADLSLDQLRFAQQNGDKLVLAGRNGIHQYDAVFHSWTRPFTREIQTALAETDGKGFVFAYDRAIGVWRGTVAATWPTPVGDRVTKLLFGSSADEVIALTERGNAYSVSLARGTSQWIHQRGATSLDPSGFTSALSAGDSTLLIGPQGAFLHDVSARTYADVPATNLPKWLAQADTRFVNAGATAYAVVNTSSANPSVYALPTISLTSAAFFTGGQANRLAPVGNSPAGPWTRIWATDAGELGILAGSSAFALTVQGARRLTGPDFEPLNQAALSDVAVTSATLFAANPNGLMAYDLETRVWQQRRNPFSGGAYPVEVVYAAGEALLRGSDGRLVAENGTAWIGDPRKIDIGDAQLSDARVAGSIAYLAGGKRVVAYDMDKRALAADPWTMGGDEVQIKGIVNAEPVALADGKFWLGNKSVPSQTSDRVVRLSVGAGQVWSVRDAGDHLYVMAYPIANPANLQPQCLFRQPLLGPSSGDLRDSRELDNARILVAGREGMRLYDPSARTWFSVTIGGGRPTIDRIFRVGSQVVLAGASAISTTSRLQFVSSAQISQKIPASCSGASIDLVPDRTEDLSAYAVDEAAGRVAGLRTTGQVVEWRNGVETQILAAPLPAPQQLRAFLDRQDQGQLMFSADGRLWRYDLDQRFWKVVTPDGRTWADISLANAGDVNLAMLKRGPDEFEMIEVDPRGAPSPIQPVWSAAARPLPSVGVAAGLPADLLRDVQTRDPKQWTFVFEDRVAYFDVDTRSWTQTAPLTPDGQYEFFKAGNRGVIVGGGGATWKIATTVGANPTNFWSYALDPSDTGVALDDGGGVWRLTSGGTLVYCAESAACRTQSDSYYFPRGSALRATEWRNIALFETKVGLIAIDLATSKSVGLPVEAAAITPLSMARAIRDNGYLLYSEVNRRLLILGGALQRLDSYSDVDAPVFDDTDTPWIRRNGDWLRWTGTQFRALDPPTGAPPFRAVFATNSAPVTAIDSAGNWYYVENGRWAKQLLPIFNPPASLAALTRESGGIWWALSGQKLIRFGRGDCVTTPQLAPVATVRPTTGLTATVTPVPTPVPTAVPVIPCLLPLESRDVALGDLRLAQVGSGSARFVDRDGRIVEGKGNLAGSAPLNWVESRDPAAVPTFLADDKLPAYAPLFRVLPNGIEAFNPLITMARSGDKIVAARVGGQSEALPGRGYLRPEFERPPELDAGWIRWNRTDRSFNIRTSNGQRAFAPGEVFSSGRLRFETMTAGIALQRNRIALANSFGVWQFSSAPASLRDPQLVYTPLPLDDSVYPLQDRFVVGAEQIRPSATGWTREPLAARSAAAGNVQLVEIPANRSVDVSVSVSGQLESAGAGGAFVWDANRRGLAYANGALWLLSDAGVSPINQRLVNFDAGPSGLARRSQTRLVPNLSTEPLLLDGAAQAWFQRGATGWQAVGDLENQRRNSVNGRPYPGDLLVALAAQQNRVLLATDSSFEKADGLGALQSGSSLRQPPLGANDLRFETYADASAKDSIYAFENGNARVWDESSSQFVPAANPELDRILVQTARLRVSRRGGVVVKELRLDSINNPNNWVSFNFLDGRLPIDVVTSIAADGDRLFVGSGAGVQVFDADKRAGLNTLAAVWDLGASSSGPLAADYVGVPPDQTDRVRAFASSGGCAEQIRGGALQPCDTRPSDRLRAQNGFWQWRSTTGPTGRAVGRYLLANGSLDTDTLRVQSGRLPHDVILDANACEGRVFTIWANGRWITAHAGGGLGIRPATENHQLPQGDSARSVICLAGELSFPGVVVPAGAYVEASSGRIWRFAAGAWQLLDEQQVLRLREYDGNRPSYERSRLRLVKTANDRKLVFQLQGLDRDWRTLQWVSDPLSGGWLVSIDDWRELTNVDGALWAATPGGLLPVRQNPAGRSVVDPNQVTLTREPSLKGVPCGVSDIKPVARGRVAVRCDNASTSVFEGELTISRDVGGFASVGLDPFVEQIYVPVSARYPWEWKLAGRANGSRGNVVVTHLGEDTKLVGGGFPFDAINSVALFEPKRVDWGTRSGWYRLPRGPTGVGDMTRPEAPDLLKLARETSRITLSRSNLASTNPPVLCLQLSGNRFWNVGLSSSGEAAPECREYLGRDDLWHYDLPTGGSTRQVAITTNAEPAIGGNGTRRLSAGRFTDDRALSIPIATRSAGVIHYWMPTPAGVVEWQDQPRVVRLHVGAFPGLASGQVPFALYPMNGVTATYAVTGGLNAISGSRETVLGLPLPQVEIARVTNSHGGTLRVRPKPGGWVDTNPASKQELANGVTLNVSRLEKYQERRAEWGVPEPVIGIQLGTGVARVQFGNRAPRDIRLPAGFQAQDAFLVQNRLLLIGRVEILELGLDRIMVDSFK